MRFLPILLFLLLPALAHAFEGLVVSVTDGDTLIVTDAARQRQTIRLLGIDAPDKYQAFGQKSHTSLSAISFNRNVEVIGTQRDRQGRLLARVMVADPNCNMPECLKIHDAGLVQLMSGMAWQRQQYVNEQTPQERETYAAAEFNAKIRRLGLWADVNPVPPWLWRR